METARQNEIVDSLKSEEAPAFKSLYDNYFPMMKNYIIQNTGTPQDAEDNFQEAIIVLLQKIRQPDFTLTSSLSTYLFAIAGNCWLKQLRTKKYMPAINEKVYESGSSLESIGTGTDPFSIEMPSPEMQVRTWLQKIKAYCRGLLKAIFFYQQPMDALMTKKGWKNKHTAANQKHKCLQQIKNQKGKGILP